MKVPKEIKEHLEKLPAHLLNLATEAISLSENLTKSAEGISEEVAKLEVVDD